MAESTDLEAGQSQPSDATDEEWTEFLDLSCMVRRVVTGRRDLRLDRAAIPRQWRTGLYERNPLYSLSRGAA